MTRFLNWLNETPDRRILIALLTLCAMIYIPLTGNYGMWDPWETHYGEVARQMLERHDYISLWWPGSPQDRSEFWSKPVLTFWLIALSMKVAGIQWASSLPNEMVASWRVEWASRMPFVILGVVGVWSVWDLTRRLVGRRAGLLAAIILATSSQWAFISRQAMTDMAFVAPMTVALMLCGIALLAPGDEFERELERRPTSLGFSIPKSGAFYGLMVLIALTVVPPLIIISAQLQTMAKIGPYLIKFIGLVPMLPYWGLLILAIFWSIRAKNKRQLYLHSAFVLAGLATLAKGPAGLALPSLVVGFYLALAGRWKDIFTKLELISWPESGKPKWWQVLRAPGALYFVVSAFPWYHAMLVRHGMGFWNEFIGDNYVRRSAGRHGDRGAFEYYLQYVGYGMFPWSGIVTASGLWAFIKLRRPKDAKSALVLFALVWFLVEFTIMTAVATKFHHYILPALPALAVLAGIFLDDLMESPILGDVLLLVFVALPITFFCGHDLAAFPPRLLWMFNYDYVNAPGTGRPWPLTSLYGDRYEYGRQILILTGVVTLSLLTVIGAIELFRRKRATEEVIVPKPVSAGQLLLSAGGFAVALVLAIALGPSTPHGVAPVISRLAWLGPTVLAIPFVLLVFRACGQPIGALFHVMTILAVVWTGFLLNKILIELSPHWAQKHVIASYYANRKGPEEPLIAWQLYWRGENFYTRNEIYSSPTVTERTVFLGDHNAEKMQTYFTTHTGRRVFFVVERTRLESLRGLLPQKSRASLHVIDESNNKIYLAVADI